MQCATVDLGHGRQAHRSGALWIEQSKTALVADVHLGYGWAQRRRGQLGPVIDTKSGLKLDALVNELRPARIVFLGDLVHAPKPAAPEREAIESTLRNMNAAAEIVVVRGNHDRAFARDFDRLGLRVVDEWQENGLTAVHGDRLFRSALPTGHLVLGHLHPALGIRDAAGAWQRLPLFLSGGGFTVLPAFSPFAAGTDIGRGVPRDVKKLAGRIEIVAIAITGTRAVRLGPLDEILRRRAEM